MAGDLLVVLTLFCLGTASSDYDACVRVPMPGLEGWNEGL